MKSRYGRGPEIDRRTEDLHICPKEDCGSELVYPIEWTEASEDTWHVTCRCPNCEWLGVGTYHQNIVDIFDVQLNRDTERLVDEFKKVVRHNMEEYLEQFAGALAADAIMPEDFNHL